MRPTVATRSQSLDLDDLRNCLFSVTKLRWGLGVTLGYLATITVPMATFSKSPEWIGPCVAMALAIVGRFLTWHSESIRSDAEWLHRGNELARGIDRRIDDAAIATIRSKYSRYNHKVRSRQSDEASYYETSGPPSSRLLLMMLRESAWWTQQLASKAWKTVGVTAGLVAAGSVIVVVMVARTTGTPILLAVYAVAVCIILSSDTAYLAAKYRNLCVAAKESFDRLNALRSNEAAEEAPILAAIADYQISRANGPLIPNWFKKHHEETLQEIWDETLSDNVVAEPRTG